MLAGALATGVIITAITSGFGANTYNYMFGTILGMKESDVLLSIVLAVCSIFIYSFFYNRLFLITFDEKFAKASGISVTLYQFLISILTAFIIVIGMRMMGTLLISSLIVFPCIIAKKTTVSFKGLVIMSGIISVLCFCIGMLVSYYLDLPTGAVIVAIYYLLLGISIVTSKI